MGFIIGFLIGGTIGAFIIALCVSSGQADEENVYDKSKDHSQHKSRF